MSQVLLIPVKLYSVPKTLSLAHTDTECQTRPGLNSKALLHSSIGVQFINALFPNAEWRSRVRRRLIQADTVIHVAFEKALCKVLILDHCQFQRCTLEPRPAYTSHACFGGQCSSGQPGSALHSSSRRSPHQPHFSSNENCCCGQHYGTHTESALLLSIDMVGQQPCCERHLFTLPAKWKWMCSRQGCKSKQALGSDGRPYL